MVSTDANCVLRNPAQRIELETAERPPDARAAAAYDHASQCLEPLKQANLLEVLDGPTAITPRLRVIVTGGHTPSHQCPIFASGDATFLFKNLPWFAWPALPLVLWTLFTRGRGFNGGLATPGVHDHQIACGRLGPSWEANGDMVDAAPFT